MALVVHQAASDRMECTMRHESTATIRTTFPATMILHRRIYGEGSTQYFVVSFRASRKAQRVYRVWSVTGATLATVSRAYTSRSGARHRAQRLAEPLGPFTPCSARHASCSAHHAASVRDYRDTRIVAEMEREFVTVGYATEMREYEHIPDFRDWLISNRY